MDTFTFPTGKFSYGAGDAVAVDVKCVYSEDTGLAPVSYSAWKKGDNFVVLLNRQALSRAAEALQVDRIRLAHWRIALETARVLVGKAAEELNTVLTDSQWVYEDWFDELAATEQRRTQRRMGILLAIELARGLLQCHPALARKRDEEEVIRRHFLSRLGVSVESRPITEHACVLGEEGAAIREQLATRILPWMKRFMGA